MPPRAIRGCPAPTQRPHDVGSVVWLYRAGVDPAIGFPGFPSIATETTGWAESMRRLRKRLHLPSSRNVLRISMRVINSGQLGGLKLQWTLHHHLQTGALRDDNLVTSSEKRVDQTTGHARKTTN